MKNIINIAAIAIITSLSIVVTGSSAFTLPPVNTNPPIPMFKCGPGLLTYQATLTNNGIVGKGMRCLKPTMNMNVSTGPYFAWYGEGTIGNCTERVLGHAFFGAYTNSPTNTNTINKASAENIWGNGECRQQNHNNLLINTYNNLQTIVVTGSLTEKWTKVTTTYWQPLPRINTCGNPVGLDTYKAVDGPAGIARSGGGIRCVLKYYMANTTWFGNGFWNNSALKYTELGTKKNNNFGTSSINGGSYGVLSFFNPYGSYVTNWVPTPKTFSPVKDELWY
jgi:hypothetical protein